MRPGASAAGIVPAKKDGKGRDAIKAAIDPDNIMNPGKMLPEQN